MDERQGYERCPGSALCAGSTATAKHRHHHRAFDSWTLLRLKESIDDADLNTAVWSFVRGGIRGIGSG